jgi:hypothetical protein
VARSLVLYRLAGATATVLVSATATVLVSLSPAQGAAPPARAAGTSAPTLGVVPFGSNRAGLGQVKPRRVDLGGDATSLVRDVRWRSWGGARAVGHGKAIWVWPGWCVACGAVQLRATVVAFGKTTCEGHSAYAYVEWFFPSRGQSFNRRLAGENLCGKGPPPKLSLRLSKCGQVLLRSGDDVVARAIAVSMVNSPISCDAARQFVADSGAARYLGRTARYTVDGWWCGSQLTPMLFGLQGFSCERGDFANVEFELGRP